MSPMTIQEKQNLPESIAKLAAQRNLYRSAKLMRNVDILLALGSVLLSVLGVIINVDELSHVVNFVIAVTWFVSQCIIKDHELRLKTEAATIQEDFDCTVLDLPWSEHKNIRRPTSDRIRQLESIEKTRQETNRLTDWYPPKAIPNDPTLATLHCQKLNCWWDAVLREKWNTTLKWSFGTIFVVGVGLAVQSGITVARLTLLAVSALRVLAWVFGEIKAQNSTIRRTKSLHDTVTTTYEAASNFSSRRTVCLSDLRNIQNEILDHRRSNPPVPDWFYRWHKNKLDREASSPSNRPAN